MMIPIVVGALETVPKNLNPPPKKTGGIGSQRKNKDHPSHC